MSPDNSGYSCALFLENMDPALQLSIAASISSYGLDVTLGTSISNPKAGTTGVITSLSHLGGDLSGILSFVRGGGRAVVFVDTPILPSTPLLAELGVASADEVADTEWFLKLVDSDYLPSKRLSPESRVRGNLTIFQPLEGSEVVGVVNISLIDRPVILLRHLGRGALVVIGLPISSLVSCGGESLAAIAARTIRLSELKDGSSRSSVGIGVVGYGPYGGMGYFHGTAVTATDGLDFVAVLDPDRRRLKAAESDFPGINTYSDISSLTTDPSIDLLIVATPPSSHFEIAKELLQAGKHVVLEKPMCLGVRQADELFELAEKNQRVITVNQNRRWDQDFRTIAKLIKDGELGEIFNIETFVGGFEHPCRAWHSDELISGGTAYDWGAHHIDWMLQLLADKPSTVTAVGHKKLWYDVTNLDQIRVRMAFTDGREAEFFQSDISAFRKPKFYIQGTKGTLIGHYRQVFSENVEAPFGYQREDFHHAEAPAELRVGKYTSDMGLSQSEVGLLPEDRFGFHRNLANHLELKEPLAVQSLQIRNVIEILEAAQISASEGGRVVELNR